MFDIHSASDSLREIIEEAVARKTSQTNGAEELSFHHSVSQRRAAPHCSSCLQINDGRDGSPFLSQTKFRVLSDADHLPRQQILEGGVSVALTPRHTHLSLSSLFCSEMSQAFVFLGFLLLFWRAARRRLSSHNDDASKSRRRQQPKKAFLLLSIQKELVARRQSDRESLLEKLSVQCRLWQNAATPTARPHSDSLPVVLGCHSYFWGCLPAGRNPMLYRLSPSFSPSHPMGNARGDGTPLDAACPSSAGLDPASGGTGALDRGCRPVLGIPVLCGRAGSLGGGTKVLDDYERG
jgi:hypothetical protein